MNIYHYDKNTKEYLLTKVAEADPAETKIQGVFVPLVPAYVTLIAPPTVKNEQVAVFENNDWTIKVDLRGKYIVDEKLNVIEITTIGDIEGIVLNKELATEIKNQPDYYKIVSGNVVKKSDAEREQEQVERETERIAILNLTSADVERAIYKVKGLDFDDILKLVKDNPSIDAKALKIELKANNFYRGNPYVSTIGNILGFTEEQLDKFFETGNYEELM